jgi:pyruvate formate lyase activating enzyme
MEKVGRVDILPSHKLGIEKYKRLGIRYRMPEMLLPTSEKMSAIAETLRSHGLDVKIGGWNP